MDAAAGGWGLLGAFSVSIETPESELWFPGSGTICGYDNGTTCPQTAQAGNALGLAAGAQVPNPLKSDAPDLTAAWYIPQPWGHVDFSAVLRPQLESVTAEPHQNLCRLWRAFRRRRQAEWFGWDKDFFTWHVVGGQAIGPFINTASANSGLGLVSNYGAPGVAAPNTVINPVPACGANLGYRHVWTPELRSNTGVGIYQEDINNLNGNVCRTNTAAARAGAGGCNLNSTGRLRPRERDLEPGGVCRLRSRVLLGQRTTTGNESGVENVLISRFRVRF